MRRLLSCLASFAALIATPAAAAELTVDAASNFLIDATINGHRVRLRVDPETSGYIILNGDAVARVGLRRSLLRSRTQIGPVRLDGWSKVAELSIGGVAGDRRMVWIDRDAVDGADGLIGPADLHYDRVTFVLGAARPDETVTSLPLAFVRSAGLSYPLRLGEDLVQVQFSLIKPDSLATAAAGARIAALFGGAWTGPPRDQLIEFGVVRPVRPLALATPVALDSFRFDRLLVRTIDNRGNLDLPPEPDADPEEIVVSGSRQRALFALTLGLDRLGRCSRLVWDNIARRLDLHCPGT